MPWFAVDDQFHEHPKPHRAGVEAVGLWSLAGSYCADNLTDGFVPERVLSRWAQPAKARRLAARLVAADMWHPDEQDGEKGWRFHDWADFQFTRKSLEEHRRKKAEAGRKGGKASGRSRREASASAGASSKREANANENEAPTHTHPLRVVASSSQSSSAPGGIDDDGLTRIKKATKGSDGHARKTAEFILAKAPADVRNPTAYVLAAISDDPDAYRYRRGNPKKGEECPTHAGQWADACAGCAADRKAAGA